MTLHQLADKLGVSIYKAYLIHIEEQAKKTDSDQGCVHCSLDNIKAKL